MVYDAKKQSQTADCFTDIPASFSARSEHEHAVRSYKRELNTHTGKKEVQVAEAYPI